MSFNIQKQERTQEAANIKDVITKELIQLRKRNPRREEYIPNDALPKWVTPSAIGRWVETSNIDPVDKRKIKEQICKLAMKTFCILVQIGREDSIQYFIQRSDSTGPDNMLWAMTSESLKEFLEEANQKLADSWPEEKCEEFCLTRWKYVAVDFTPDVDNRVLPEKAVLPFLMSKTHIIKGDSQLSIVHFDAQYFRLARTDSNMIEMMRKKLVLKSGDREKDFLRYLQTRPKPSHPHIIELYAYYSHKGSGYLLMPLLEGDLKGLLERDELTSHFQNDSRYLEEMLNLSRAMTSLHSIEDCPLYNTTGVHNDLKPANILLDSDGRFVLSDFGISNLRCPTGSQEKESQGFDSWYLAPETRWKGPWHGKAGPQGDVFSLGCIFTELLVHMRGGKEAVAAFREGRKPDKDRFYSPFHVDEKIIDAVLAELESVRQDTKCVERAQFAGVVLEMLRVDPTERLSSEGVVAKFEHILGETDSGSIPTSAESFQQYNRPSKTPNTSEQRPSGGQRAEVGMSPSSVSEQTSALGVSSGSQVGVGDRGAEKKHTLAGVVAALVYECEYENDSRHFLRVDGNLTIKQQGQVMSIWKQRQWIQDWASSATSCVLFLRGDRESDDKILSYIAARVIESARDVQEPSTSIVLRHFCNQNKKNGDMAVVIMMQSLLRQLLSHQDRAESLNLPSCSFSGTNIESLRITFETTVKALPVNSTVVCVIDGLHSYYDPNSRVLRAREMKETLPTLIKMVQLSQTTHCRFKLLLTASKQHLVNRIYHDGDIKADDLHPIGHDVLNMQGLRGSFWAENQLAWV